MNRSTGRLFHCAPFHRLESSETGIPRVLRAAVLLRLHFSFVRGWASAKPPHSCRPRFELVTQPEGLSVPLTRPFAPATMLGLAALALRVWASSNGRPLHSGPFILRDKTSRPRVPGLFIPSSPPHSGCFLRLFYARRHPTVCCSPVRHRAEFRSEIKSRASVSLLPFRHCHGFCFRLVWNALGARLRCLPSGEASSKRQGDGQRFQKKL